MKLTKIIFISMSLIFVTPTVYAVNLFAYKELFQTHQFEKLEQSLQKDNDAYLAGEISTDRYFWSVETVLGNEEKLQPWMEEALTAWITKQPNSPYANILMGKYYSILGFNARGVKFASETSEEQFADMKKYFAKAFPYLHKGTQLNPHIIQGHRYILQLIRTSNTYRPKFNVVEAILQYIEPLPKDIKQNIAIWNYALQDIVPRWGGSYEDMENMIENHVKKYIPNISTKEVNSLRDAITWDKMQLAYKDKNFQEMLNIGQEALNKHTNYAGIYDLASTAAYQTQQYNLCHQYAKTFAEKRPWRFIGWYNLGVCSSNLRMYKDAVNAYEHKIYLSKINTYDVFKLGDAYMNLHDFNKAYILFKKAEYLSDGDYKKYTQNYVDYIESNNLVDEISEEPTDEEIYEIIGNITYDPN